MRTRSTADFPRETVNMAQALTQPGPPKRPTPATPSRWKFALVVWLAIYPSLTFLLWLAGPAIVDWPLALRTFVFTALLVPWMVYVMIPALQRFLAPWLRHSRNQ
jgi:antibiotic biosynthesis monooxygenase (ABM) superfamily enzyme